MTVRPLDYGDQYPSDQGDTPPGNPTDGFQERDYRINTREQRGKKPKPDLFASPSLEIDRERPESRHTFMGVIVKKLPLGNQYIVLRQDGKRGIAYTRGDDRVYDELRPAETVIMTADQTPGVWTIEGSERRKEMASFRVINSGNIIAQSPTLIPFDTLVNSTGEDADGVNPIFRLSSGGVRVLQSVSGQYELSVSVNIENLDTSSGEGTVRAACPASPNTPWKGTQKRLPLDNGIVFDRWSGFSVMWDEVGCQPVVALRPGQYNFYTLLSHAGNSVAKWTDGPAFRSLTLSIDGRAHPNATSFPTRGWLKLLNNHGGVVELSSGYAQFGRIRWGLPTIIVDGQNTTPFGTQNIYSNRYLYLDSFKPNSPAFDINLRWSSPGVTGTIRVVEYHPGGGSPYQVTKEWFVDKGLIVGGHGMTNEPDRSFPGLGPLHSPHFLPCEADPNV